MKKRFLIGACMMLGGIGLALGFFWIRHISQEERKIEGCLASYFHFQNFYPEGHYWYDPRNEVPKKWDDQKPRKVKYLQSLDPSVYLVMCETFDTPNEELMAHHRGKVGKYFYTAIRFHGNDYRIEESWYGEDWYEFSSEPPRYANDEGCIERDTGCPRDFISRLFDAKSDEFLMKRDGLFSFSLRQIHLFTMPPLKQLKAEGLVRDAGKLPKEFFSVLKETVKAEGPRAGLIVISPVADLSVDYEGVVFPKPKSALGTGRFEYSGTWPWNRDPPSMFFPQNAEYKYVRPKCIVFENPCASLLETLSNPLFDMHDFNDAMHLLVDLHLAWKYFELGSIYYFENTGKDVEFTRLK